ncbi:class II fructose-bisphosphate aldolase family protein [bacterium]|nr:class II fructose-bisphosphate aldolase family protein [bacterium]
MKSLKEIIADAESGHKAIGHFNISNIEGLWGVFGAARELGVPVIIGVSEGERKFIGVRQSVALIRSLREEFDYPVYLNADHTYSVEGVREAALAGFDSIIFDGAKMPFAENIAKTKECVDFAHSVNPEILVEGEVGFIGTSSKIWEEIPEGASITSEMLTTPEQAREFVEKTRVNLFAPAVGNIHGMFKKMAGGERNAAAEEKLDIGRIKAIREAAGAPLVLHGGSGIADADFVSAIQAGIGIVHISTELRKAYHDALEKSLQDDPDELAPYRTMAPAVEAIKQAALGRLRLFSGM